MRDEQTGIAIRFIRQFDVARQREQSLAFNPLAFAMISRAFWRQSNEPLISAVDATYLHRWFDA